MEFKNTEVFNFEGAFRGMRNPKNSWHLSDSFFGTIDACNSEEDYDIAMSWAEAHSNWETLSKEDRQELFDHYDEWICQNGILDYTEDDYARVAYLGPKDMKLAKTLIAGGSEHRKFLRQIMVSVDITAPLFWWKEFDTYKVGTTANSTSTMHKILSQPITADSFESLGIEEWNYYLDDFLDDQDGKSADDCRSFVNQYIDFLEGLRLSAIRAKKEAKEVQNLSKVDKMFLEKKSLFLWKQLIRLLPSSWLQTRTVTLNYENLYSIYHQRKHHKLSEWSGIENYSLVPSIDLSDNSFVAWVKELPYSEDLILN